MIKSSLDRDRSPQRSGTFRFVMFDEPGAEVWAALSDVLAAGKVPRAVRVKMLKSVHRGSSFKHRIVALHGRETLLVPLLGPVDE